MSLLANKPRGITNTWLRFRYCRYSSEINLNIGAVSFIQRHFYTRMNFIYCWKAEQNHPNKAISWNVRLFWMPTITICGLLDNEANVRDAFWNITNYYSMFKLLHIYSSRNLFMPKYGKSMILKNLWDVSKWNIFLLFCYGIMFWIHAWLKLDDRKPRFGTIRYHELY